MRLSTKATAIFILLFMLGGILILMVSGLWITESQKVPIKFTEGELAGIANPADIRGSYTFKDIEDNFAVPADILARAFALDTAEVAAADYKAKDLETFYGELEAADGSAGEVGTDSVRWVVSLYMGVPYEPEETTLLPNPALVVLRDSGKIDAEQFQVLKQKSVSPENAVGDAEAAAAGETETEGALITHTADTDEKLIKGNTTFADLLGWGLSKEQIEEVLGLPMGARSDTVRNFTIEQGLEFSEYKVQLQAMLDEL